ncbi:hypothetical protein Vafri_18262 [Volvox africanus]|nr:hypothetical protein Vafri_18262 [Volvox africanus]
MLLPVGDAVPAVPTDTVYLNWFCDVSGEVLGEKGDGSAGGGGGGGGGGRNLWQTHLVKIHRRQQRREMETSSVESSANPVSPGGAADNNGVFDGLGGGSSSSSSSSNRGTTTSGSGGRLSGSIKMQLEFASANYSTYTADLLRPVDGAPVAVVGLASRVRGGSVRSCPPGVISVQVRVGDGAGSDGNSASAGVGGSGGGASGSMSSSAERPLHWYPPAAAATQSHDAFWNPMDGAGGSDSLSSVHCSPARLQQTVLEWLVMHVPWHRFGLIAAAAQWCVLTLGMLAAPRVFAVLKARQRHSQGPEHQRTSSARQTRRRHQRQRQRLRNGLPGSSAGCGSDEAEEGDADLRDPMTEAAGAAVAVARRQLDWMGECVSTSVRLGGMCGSKNGKSTVLKRSSSDSSTGGGVGVGVGRREAQSGGGDALITHTGLHTGPLNSEEYRGGGGANNSEEITSPGDSRGTTMCFRRTAWKVVRCWLLWPLRDLAELAEHRDYVPWLALVLYGVYLAVGPWFTAEFITMHAASGSIVQPALGGYGFLAAYGIYMRPTPIVPGDGAQRAGTDPRWFAAPSQDHVVIVNVVALTCIAPGLLLCASAAARLQRIAVAGKFHFRSGGMDTWQILSWRQTAALCGIAVLNVGICWKLWAGLGWTAIAMSPGVGWLLPLLAAWLWLTSSRAATLGQLPERHMTP